MSTIHEANVQARFLKEFDELESRYRKWLDDARIRIEALERVASAARSAMTEIHNQKVCWPGEVDAVDDALEALDKSEKMNG